VIERGKIGAGDDAVDRGIRYLTGKGVQPDAARGAALIERAAAAGHPEAAWLAATIASTDLWRKRDWDRALEHLAQAAEGDHGAAQASLRILAGGPRGDRVDGDRWAEMRDSVDLDAWLAPPAVETIRKSPHIGKISGFAPRAACDWLIAQARDGLSRATIYDKQTGGSTEDERRTNSQCDLDLQRLGMLTFVLRARIGAITRRTDRAMEIPKVLHYSPGETFAKHFDYLDPAEPAYAASIWCHMASRCAISPTARTGSIAPVDVVPTVEHTKNGTFPASRSTRTCLASSPASIASSSSVSIRRTFSRPMPEIIAALTTDECACVDA